MIELTDIQKAHLPAIEWLLSGPRGCGKTFLLQVAMLERSFKNQGEWFEVFDHTFNHHRNLEMFMEQLVQTFAMKYDSDKYGISVRVRNNTFKIERLKK